MYHRQYSSRGLTYLCIIVIVLCSFSLFVAGQETDKDFSSLELNGNQFALLNENGTSWFGEVVEVNKGQRQGFTHNGVRFLSDYQLEHREQLLQRNEATQLLHGNHFVRDHGEVKEMVYIPADLRAMVVRLSGSRWPLVFRPQLDAAVRGFSWTWDAQRQLALMNFPARPGSDTGSLGILVYGDQATASADMKEVLPAGQNREKQPAKQILNHIEISGVSVVHVAVLLASDSIALVKMADDILARPAALNPPSNGVASDNQIKPFLTTGDERMNEAHTWAQHMLGKLVEQGSGLMQSGVPHQGAVDVRQNLLGFNGALLTTGKFDMARELLLKLAAMQDSDPNSATFGRIPGKMTVEGADFGSPATSGWFSVACRNYVNYTGDTDFIGEIFPAIKKSLDGAIKYQIDEYGLVQHGLNDTWMNALGSEGPWTPRGNRAVEIQVLWAEQVRIGIAWADKLGYSEWVEDWTLLETRLLSNLKREFWDVSNNRIVDHINGRGIHDQRMRPNAILALSVPDQPLFKQRQQVATLGQQARELLYPWGLASLSPNDAGFHPFHYYPPYYRPDAAYHNGLIWTWLSAPFTAQLAGIRPDLAIQLLDHGADAILDKGIPGLYPAIFEAWPRPGGEDPLYTGEGEQLASTAGWIQNWQEDIVGLRPELSATKLRVSPALDKSLPFPLTFRYHYGEFVLNGRYAVENGQYLLTFEGENAPSGLQLFFELPAGDKWLQAQIAWPASGKLALVFDPLQQTLQRSGNLVRNRKLTARERLPGISFRRPGDIANVATLQKPAYSFIDGEDATRKRPRFTPLLFDLRDVKGDDRGEDGDYVYPTHESFMSGVLDIRRSRIWQNDDYLFLQVKFEEMASESELHPENIFPVLTAITLKYEKLSTIRRTKISMNANYSVPHEYAYNFIVFVGDGYRLEDGRGRVIAEYQPEAGDPPIYERKDRQLQFSIPLKYLSKRALRNAAVLTGGRDDHGGGGVGEFRSVYQKASEWFGGGAEAAAGNPSIYDVLLIRR